MSHSSKLKLLCDENIPHKLVELLIGEGFDVERVPSSLEDKNITKLGHIKNRVILTFDKDFGNILLFPPEEFSGIVLIRIRPPLISTVFSSLLKLFDEVKPSEFRGRLFSLSVSGYRVFKRRE